jgi:hypothetical protein
MSAKNQVPVTRDEYEELQRRMSDIQYLNTALLNTVERLVHTLDDMKEERDSWVILYNALYGQKHVPTLWDKVMRFFVLLRSR